MDMAKKKDELVPYNQTSLGFEAVYTGETCATPIQESDMVSTRYSDDDGNLINQWCTIPWTFPDEKGRWPEDKWDDAVKRIHEMQSQLEPLNDDTRRIRAHITSLIPCDSGLPVTVDEILFAIARGKLEGASFRNGCLCTGMAPRMKTSQPRHAESMRTIGAVLKAYLAGASRGEATKAHPEAAGFINRSYDWLGGASELSRVQRKMLDRMFLTLEFFAKYGSAAVDTLAAMEESEQQDMQDMMNDWCFDQDGRGASLDAEIADEAELPKIYPQWNREFQKTFEQIEDPRKKDLYEVCCAITAGVQSLSDCHHNTFRYIEGWIHGIGTGRLAIPTRKAQTEKQRLGHMLFGYALGLDRWLLRSPMQLLLLDLGHIDLGFNPRDNILRVYACLGEEATDVKRWLAACLWYNLVRNEQGGLVSHTDLVQQCGNKGVTVHEWMDSS